MTAQQVTSHYGSRGPSRPNCPASSKSGRLSSGWNCGSGSFRTQLLLRCVHVLLPFFTKAHLSRFRLKSVLVWGFLTPSGGSLHSLDSLYWAHVGVPFIKGKVAFFFSLAWTHTHTHKLCSGKEPRTGLVLDGQECLAQTPRPESYTFRNKTVASGDGESWFCSL